MKPLVTLGTWLTIDGFKGVVVDIKSQGVELRGESGVLKSFSLAKVEELF